MPRHESNRANAILSGSAGVSPAVFGLWPKTFLLEAVGGTPTAATGTVALPKPKRVVAERKFAVPFAII